MPILNVDVVVGENETLDPALPRKLADAAGETFGTSPGQTWVKVNAVTRDQYDEQGGLDSAVSPVIAEVLKGQIQDDLDALEAEARELTSKFAEILGRPAENVHIIYAPEGIGRVVFGGKLVR